MKKNKIKKDSDKESNLKIFFKDAGNYIKVKYPYLLLAFLSFIALSLLTYFKLKTVPVITGFSIDEYRIGQVSDRTIIADRDIAPDEEYPIEIVEGEEIISKGFVITEEKFEKLKKISATPNYIDYRSYANTELFLLRLIICW